jgi:hypothetical protein
MTELGHSRDELLNAWELDRDQRIAYQKRQHARLIDKFYVRISALVGRYKELMVVDSNEERHIWWSIEQNSFIEQVPKILIDKAHLVEKLKPSDIVNSEISAN